MLTLRLVAATVTVLVLGTCCALGAPSKELPKSFPRCKLNTPKTEDCLLKAINRAIPELVKGIPSLSVNTIDPLVISRLHIDQGVGPVSLNLSFWDMKIHGFSKAKLTSLKENLKKYEIEGDVVVPGNIKIVTMYKSFGRVLVLPLRGEGLSNLTLVNTTAHLKLAGEGVKRNGQVYMKIKNFSVKFDTKKLVVYFEKLFSGNGQLSGATNQFLNENWREILGELKPAIEDAFGQAFLDIASRIFDKVPFNKIFFNE